MRARIVLISHRVLVNQIAADREDKKIKPRLRHISINFVRMELERAETGSRRRARHRR